MKTSSSKTVLLAGLLVGSLSASAVDYVWTGAASSDWQNQQNWNPDTGIPGQNDNVTLNSTLVTAPSNAQGQIHDLTLGTCVILGVSDLTINGTFNFNRGILQNGTVTISGTGTMNCNSGGSCVNGNSLNNCTVVNNGVVNAISGGLGFYGATFNNQGTFNLGDQSLASLTGTNRFNNGGSFQTVPGTTAATVNVPFDNSGIVSTRSGELRFLLAVTSEGNFEAQAGGTNRFTYYTTNNPGASFSGAGWAVVDSGGVEFQTQTNLQASNLELRSGGIAGVGTLAVSDNLVWGALAGVVRIPLSAQGSCHSLIFGGAVSGGTFTNFGQADWVANNLTGDQGAIFQNSGTLVMHHNGIFTRRNFGSGADPVFYNSGTFVRTNDVQNGTGQFARTFNNSGTLRVDAGGLEIWGGGTNGSSFKIAGTLIFDSTPYTMDIGSTVEGNGTNRLSSPGTTVNVNGAHNFDGLTSIEAGTINFNNTTPAGCSSGRAALAGGTITANGLFTVRTNFDWSSGTIAGSNAITVATLATLNIFSSSAHTIAAGGTLNNDGTGLWTDNGQIQFSGANGVFNNRAGATFEARNNATITGNGIVINSGSYLKTAAGVSLISSAKFNNLNSVQIQAGTLQLTGGGTNNGANFNASAGATNDFNAGTYYFSGGNAMSGVGWSRASGATLTISNSLAAQNLELAGGTINGPGGFNLSGNLLWDGGSTLDPGTSDLGPLSQATITGSGTKTLGGFTTNRGTVTWSGAGGISSPASAVFNNGGTFYVETSASWTTAGGSASAFNNAGLFRKLIDTNISSLFLSFTNTGQLVASSGTMDFGGGSYLGMSNSVVTGAAALKGNFPQFGVMSPGEPFGRLQITGSFSQNNSSTMNVLIGGLVPVTNFTVLTVTGGATLGGVLNVILTNGFTPSVGDSFPILSCGARTNIFSTVAGARVGGLIIAPVYTATNVILKVINELHLESPALSGTNFRFSFESASGFSYAVQYADTLPPAVWHPLTNIVGDGSLKLAEDFSISAASQRYYRVVLQ